MSVRCGIIAKREAQMITAKKHPHSWKEVAFKAENLSVPGEE